VPKVKINKSINFCIISAFDVDSSEFVMEIQKLRLDGWKLEGGITASNNKIFQSMSKQ